MSFITNLRSRWTGVLLVTVGVALLAACSTNTTASGASGDSSPSSAYQKALAYAQCIRTHGVPSYPDPNSKGQFFVANGASDPTANVSLTVLNAAAKACQKLQPPSMVPPTAGGGTSNQAQGLKFSECMRSHGEPDFPDPASNGSITLPPGMNYQSPQFQKASSDCQSLRPSTPGGGAAP